MTKQNRSYFSYWGKARDGSGECHLLPYHALDAAAAGKKLLEKRPSLLETFSKLTGLPQKQFSQWFVFMMALHDIGKFAASFQNLKPDLLKKLQNKSSSQTYSSSFKHDSLGLLLWEKRLREKFQGLGLIPAASSRWRPADSMDFWIRAVAGHHGQPPKPSNRCLRDDFDDEDGEAASEFLEDLIPILLPDGHVFHETCADTIKKASFWIAGLAVASDWIGSDTRFFKYKAEIEPLGEYWEKTALKQAEQAVCAAGILEGRPSEDLKWEDVFLGKAARPRPMQQLVSDIKIPKTPCMFILEDATGSGKTEAALFLAHRMMKGGLGGGLYFALPTMATSNAMYGRLKGLHGKLFEPGASLILAHSARELVKEFKDSVLPEVFEAESDYGDETKPAGFYCSAWLADSGKKALLAYSGAGTVDQALLAVLPARHQSLRMLGLLNKILIIDEVHAYDSYTNKLLRILLEAHALSGGSAILLSATLPKKQKQALINCYNKAPGGELRILKEESYPLLSCFSGQRLRELPAAPRKTLQKPKAVQFVSEKHLVHSALERAVEKKSCACWIRNTVRDAVQSFRDLRERHPDWKITLFHSRFALGDRLDIEKDVMSWFGGDSSPEGRSGRVLIATQVVEQSLDLDFDVLISDLAPIDLLIQRAGRLHRRRRDLKGGIARGEDQRGPAKLLVYSPEWTESPDKNWLSGFFKSAGKIYPDHGKLWLSVKALKEHGGIQIPENARALIEGVYGEEAQKLIPEGLLGRANEAEGSELAALSFASESALSIGLGYTNEQEGWRSAARISTRLGEETKSICLAKWEGGRLRPWRGDSKYAWQYSSVSMRSFFIKEAAENPQIPKNLLEECRKSLPAEGRWGELLPLVKEKAGDGWKAMAINEKGEPVQFVYSRSAGLNAPSP